MKLILKIVIVLLVILAAAGFGFTSRRYCPTDRGVTAFVNGNKQTIVANRCPNKLIRIAVPGNPDSSVLVDRENQRLLVPATQFYEVFGFVFAREIDPTGVSFFNRIRIERRSELHFFENGFSIKDSTTGYHVVVEFNEV